VSFFLLFLTPDLMCIFPVLLIQIVVSINTVEIEFRSDGSIRVPHVIVQGLQGPFYEAVLTIDSHRVIDVRPHERYVDEISGLMFTENDPSVEFGDDRRDLVVTSYGDHETSVTIGIGPGSFVLQRYGAISVIRNVEHYNGTLVLGELSARLFNDSCVPGSIASFPYHARGSRSTVSIQQSVRTVIGRQTQNSTTGAVAIGGTSRRIITVPLSIAQRINRIILSSGAFPMGMVRDQFVNCYPEEVLNILPELVVRFAASGDFVILYPEDYVVFENDECSLRIGIPLSEYWESRFDPLRIPSINLHITSGQILICDSL
jgi:hypothetical protein